MRRRLFSTLGLCVLAVTPVLAQTSRVETPKQTLARTVAEVGVNFGLNLKQAPTPGEQAYLRVLFDAALELDPNLEIAHRGQFELANLNDDPDALSQAINAWFKAAPQHSGLAALWLDEQSKQWHTSEARERGLLKIIAEPNTTSYVKGLAYVHLARLANERLDSDRVNDCLANAVKFLPNHPEAVLARFDMLAADAPPLIRLQRALEVLTLNPVHVEAAWEAGLALHDAGLAEEAAPFFEHAQQVFQTVRPSAVAPAIYHVHLAENLIARNQITAAVERLRIALALDPSRIETAFLLLWTLEKAGLHGASQRLRDTLAERFARIRDPQRWPTDELLQAAWYHITVDPQPERALLLAQAAAEQAPRDTQAKRILAFALALNGHDAEARELFESIAKSDLPAAVWLAERAMQADDADAARRWLTPFMDRYPVGRVGEQLNALRKQLAPPEPPAEENEAADTPAENVATETVDDPNAAAVAKDPNTATTEAAPADPNATKTATTPPKRRLTPAQQEIEAVRSAFDFNRLTFFRQPSEFIEFGVRFADPTRAPGEPWWVAVTLHNRSDAPFMLGPDGAFNSVVALSLEIAAQRTITFPNLLTINFDETRLLGPGETIRAWRRIDVGPVHALLQRNPRLLIRANVTAVLDPVEDAAGQWVPGVGGQQHDPVYLSRAPFVPSVEALDLLIRRLQGDQRSARRAALEQVSTLLGEQQRARLNPEAPGIPAIPTDRLITPLRGMLETDNTDLRCAALLSLDAAGLNSYLLEAVQRCLEHDNWTVRLLTARVLYRLGPNASEQLDKLAKSDPQPLVQRMAAALQQRLNEAQPPAETEK